MQAMKKKCRDCRQRKDSSAFSNNRNERDGLMRVCRGCRSHHRAQGTRYGITVKTKQCSGCLERKAASSFSINRADRTGLDRLCRECKQTVNSARPRNAGSVVAKACQRCGEFKDTHCFSVVSVSKDGLARVCKDCQSKAYKVKSFPVSVTHKTCGVCKARKQASRFYRNQRNVDGMSDKCKECVRRIRVEVRHPIAVSSKACSKCGKEKAASEFFADPMKVSGLRSECKECSRPVSATYRRKRKAVDPLFKFITKARSIANKLIRYGWNKSDRGPAIIGCSYEHAFKHICTFARGDGADADALPDGYHLDHNIPMIAASSLAEARLLSHWTNIQLLISDENLRKKDRLPSSLVPINVRMTRTDRTVRRKQAVLLKQVSQSKRFRGKAREL